MQFLSVSSSSMKFESGGKGSKWSGGEMKLRSRRDSTPSRWWRRVKVLLDWYLSTPSCEEVRSQQDLLIVDLLFQSLQEFKAIRWSEVSGVV